MKALITTKVVSLCHLLNCLEVSSTNSVNQEQIVSIGAESTPFASIFALVNNVSKYMQWVTYANNNFRCSFFTGALKISLLCHKISCQISHLFRQDGTLGRM